ncbi:hypothetical protein [Saccharothrix variisporea]|uniref:Uncharacterized protein n=1 Tax=Saccharothrix variisporea TaxID=543527 RepID=A0A495XHM6_9PSEU|nr:hypothetical protein [Saccharothrix variisporea]RKT72043.1 hypothetical protein DFJ66_5346 [Saccharothrix variisporea]
MIIVLLVGVPVAARLIYLIGLVFYRMTVRTKYALAIETTGGRYTTQWGADRQAMERVRDEIYRAIENPPADERVVHVSGDIVYGDKIARDKYIQGGSGNSITVSPQEEG